MAKPQEDIELGWQEPEERPTLDIVNPDGTPRLWLVKVKLVKPKIWPAKPATADREAQPESRSFTWVFEVAEPGEFAGVVIFGSTNDAMYVTKAGKASRLLQLIMAVNGGKKPEPGANFKASDLTGKLLRVELENKDKNGDIFQSASRYYPALQTAQAAAPAAGTAVGTDAPVEEEIPVINLEDEPEAPTGDDSPF